MVLGQTGLNVVYGNSVTQNGLVTIGNESSSHIAIDGDDIQRKSSTGANYSTLYLNYYGGNISLANSDLYIDNANNEVGIGTTSPSAKLDINGTARVGSWLRVNGRYRWYSPLGFGGYKKIAIFKVRINNSIAFCMTQIIGHLSILGRFIPIISRFKSKHFWCKIHHRMVITYLHLFCSQFFPYSLK